MATVEIQMLQHAQTTGASHEHKDVTWDIEDSMLVVSYVKSDITVLYPLANIEKVTVVD